MNTKSKILTLLLAASMVLAGGCAQKKNNSADGTRPPVTTPADTNQVTPGDPKGTYRAEGDKATELVQLFTEKFPSSFHSVSSDGTCSGDGQTADMPTVFTGFTAHSAPTPVLSGSMSTTIVPVYSEEGLHEYFHKNAEIYDLTALAEYAAYDDSYFDDNALLIIALNDSEGAASYSVTGGWENNLSVDGRSFDELVLALQRTPGDAASSHLIVEMNKDFITAWGSFFVRTYE